MATQKITVHVDRELLRKAQKQTGQGVTATIRHALELMTASEARAALRALRGKVRVAVDLRALREDR